MDHQDRESWLTEAASLLNAMLMTPAGVPLDMEVEQRVRVSCGYPRNTRGGKKSLLIWPNENEGELYQIYISPELSDRNEVLLQLLYQLVHIQTNDKGHRSGYSRTAIKCGLGRPMTEPTVSKSDAGACLLTAMEEINAMLGQYPHKKVMPKPKPQGSRLIKCECASCNFVFRASAYQLDRIQDDAPCPVCEARGRLITARS